MRNVLVATCLLLTAFASGCTDDATTDKAVLPSAAGANATTPAAQQPVVDLRYGAVGPTVTREESLEVFVESDADAAVQVLYNGTQIFGEVVNGNKTLAVTLEYGTKPLSIIVSAPGRMENSTLLVTRLGRTTITVDWSVLHTGSPGQAKSRTDEVWIDVDARPSLPLYEEVGGDHIPAYTAHDQIRQWELETSIPVVATYSPSFQGFGVDQIDGQGKPLTSQSPPYWCFQVNDVTMDVGMSLASLAPGDRVAWILGSGFC